MRYTYFPKQELKFTHPEKNIFRKKKTLFRKKKTFSEKKKPFQENMFRSFYLDGWSVPRRALGNARF